MTHCNDCQRLRGGFHGAGIPVHLSRVATLRKDGKVTFRYECGACGGHWDYCRGRGWHLDVDNRVPPPLLTRLVNAARNRIARPNPR
jgi:hypothetical protein